VYARVCAEMTLIREAGNSQVKHDIWRYIDDNCYDGNLSLDAVADRFGLSVPYMSKFIKEQTGYNFVEYIARKRVMMAKQLLVDQALTVEEIGMRIGYANVLTFRRAFKKYSGITPGEYRTMKLQSKPE
ncbi:MAG: helix-turn-helix transcriptional regulator, partial [Paenibacillaceae bacterium]|nr:helix-turn-helix transcriptional regulator [Paenibacillaceae bacterium]